MATITTPVEKNWIIVADESLARIFSQEKKFGPLRQVAELSNADARKKTGDMISDRGGRSFDSHGQGRHTMASGPGHGCRNCVLPDRLSLIHI